jgi:hypothetical protein
MREPSPKSVATRHMASGDMRIDWEPSRHTLVPVINGTPRPHDYGPWSKASPPRVTFEIVERGVRNETKPWHDYVVPGNQPGTEHWVLNIFMDGKTYTLKRKWDRKDLDAVKDWCARFLQGKVRVSGIPPV